MIICYHCKKQLFKKNGELVCFVCGYKAKTDKNIVSFSQPGAHASEDYPESAFKKIKEAESTHFWFRIRNLFILKTIKKYFEKGDELLEIGCGTGVVSECLVDAGLQVTVSDLYLSPLKWIRERGTVKKIMQFDLYRSPFIEEYKGVLMFDVLEHLEHEKDTLNNIWNMLKDKGKLMITVPAYNWLWSSIDEESGHKRRYTLSKLKALLKLNGFKVVESRYFFSFILPLLAVKRLINQLQSSEINLQINPLINGLLYGASYFELKFLSFITRYFGGSILLLAEKSVKIGEENSEECANEAN